MRKKLKNKHDFKKLKLYIEHSSEKVVEADKRFKHVMAITLNPISNYKKGIIRCITSREGELGILGAVDRSVLYKLSGNSLKKI